jgi:RNase P subunit RPR2
MRIPAQLLTAALNHPQASELVARAAREAVAAVAEQLEQRARREVVQATIERDTHCSACGVPLTPANRLRVHAGGQSCGHGPHA